MLQLGTEDKHKSLRRMMIIFVIFFVILAVILLILHFEKVKQITTQIINPQPEVKQNETAPKQLSESEIKMDIITGKRQDVPLELGEDKSAIINEYLSSCDMIVDALERVACFELYYVNNDASLKVEKQNCEKLSNAEKTKCLDNLYFTLATQEQSFFCYAIIDEALRNQCLGIV
jgi:hypothetical protein